MLSGCSSRSALSQHTEHQHSQRELIAVSESARGDGPRWDTVLQNSAINISRRDLAMSGVNAPPYALHGDTTSRHHEH